MIVQEIGIYSKSIWKVVWFLTVIDMKIITQIAPCNFWNTNPMVATKLNYIEEENHKIVAENTKNCN